MLRPTFATMPRNGVVRRAEGAPDTNARNEKTRLQRIQRALRTHQMTILGSARLKPRGLRTYWSISCFGHQCSAA